MVTAAPMTQHAQARIQQPRAVDPSAQLRSIGQNNGTMVLDRVVKLVKDPHSFGGNFQSEFERTVQEVVGLYRSRNIHYNPIRVYLANQKSTYPVAQQIEARIISIIGVARR